MKMKRDETRAAWADHLKKWRQSGLTRLEYCRDSGVKDHQLRYWAGRLAVGGSKPPAFAKAVVDAAPVATVSGGGTRLILLGGAVIEFPSTVDPSWIGRVAQEVSR
jgi:hypothetical protein